MDVSTPLTAVRETCRYVAQRAEHVTVNRQKCREAATVWAEEEREASTSGSNGEASFQVGFDFDVHFVDPKDEELTVRYFLVLDSLNFCFWPDADHPDRAEGEPSMEYQHLAGGLKELLTRNRRALDNSVLVDMTGDLLQKMLEWPRPLPQQEERARILREVGAKLLSDFDGQAANVVRRANKSAAKLVELVTGAFPNFRDHSIYRGRQVFLYKRAQILVGDLWGGFNGAGLGEFTDVDKMTMFADYRVPVVLRQLGILEYSDVLSRIVEEKEEMEACSRFEVEIRACTVMAVEALRQEILKQTGERVALPPLDWWLWEKGESDVRNGTAPPHHRVRTIFY